MLDLALDVVTVESSQCDCTENENERQPEDVSLHVVIDKDVSLTVVNGGRTVEKLLEEQL